MKIRFALLTVAVLAVTATSAFAAVSFENLFTGIGTGISSDGIAISYNSNSTTYIYSKAGGAYQIATGVSSGNTATGVAKIGSSYAVVYNSNTSGAYSAYCWKGDLTGVGTTTASPDTTFWARGVGGNGTDLNQCFVAGQYTSSGNTLFGRWKAPAGSIAGYGSNSGNFGATNQTFYAASYGGVYAGQARLSTAGSVSRKEQAVALQGSTVIMLRNGWGAPSTSYYSTAQAIAGDASVVAGYTGVSDNTTAQACYWNRDAAYTTSTLCNLIPLMDGYAKSYAMRANGDGSLIAGYTMKAAGATGVDKRTIFLYNKNTGVQNDLRTVLASAGYDMSAWGLMDITGISADGTKLIGTMLASTDTYWTTGTVVGPYQTWMVDLNAPAVPEPGSILALGTGLVGLFGMIRRRK